MNFLLLLHALITIDLLLAYVVKVKNNCQFLLLEYFKHFTLVTKFTGISHHIPFHNGAFVIFLPHFPYITRPFCAVFIRCLLKGIFFVYNILFWTFLPLIQYTLFPWYLIGSILALYAIRSTKQLSFCR